MDKRGIELAANFIIVLIISLVLFGLATGLTYKIICASNEQIDKLDSATEQRVEQLLNSGAAVTVADPSKTAEQKASFCGASDAPGASYLVGIRNDLNDRTTFTVHCRYDGLEQADASPQDVDGLGDCDAWDWQISDDNPSIDGRKKFSGLAILNIPRGASEGRHVFTVTIKRPDATTNTAVVYGVKKIYLTIK